MTTTQADHRKGLLITAIGGLFLTFDIPLIKLSDGNAWSILMTRSLFTFTVTIIIWALWRIITGKRRELIPGKSGYLVALCYGLSSIAFLTGVFNTSTANVVFILAFNPMFAALFGWIFLRIRPKPATLLTMLMMLIGVAIIVSDGIATGNMFGDIMSIIAAMLMAAAITISRASGKDMGLTAIFSTCIPFAVAAYMVVQHSGYQITDVTWIAIDGAIMMPIAFLCLATGPRYISGPEVAMFYLLETILAPIWVWLIFSEEPSSRTLVGGGIMVVALVSHSTWQLMQTRKIKAKAGKTEPVKIVPLH